MTVCLQTPFLCALLPPPRRGDWFQLLRVLSGQRQVSSDEFELVESSYLE